MGRGPGFHGPDGEREQRTLETGLPLIVCHRTGPDHTLNFTGAESLVVKDGKRIVSHHSEQSVVLTFDWNVSEMKPISDAFQADEI